VPWTPRQLQQSRYLIASDVSAQGVSLRPVFVGSLDPIDNALWSDRLWAVPARTDLVPGSFVFTNSAELVGLVITYGGRPVIVPGGTVLAQADRLLAMPPRPAGTLGIEVQDLTPPLALVTGASVGVVVTWLDANDVGGEHMMVGDVIEAVDGLALANRQHWDVRMARLSVGETLRIRVRRKRELSEVVLVARAPTARPASRSLGLTLRGRVKMGAEVVRVERASAADRAGLAVGDVITLIANAQAPTPAQVVQSFGSIEQGQRLIVAVTRGDTHFVTTLER
jgi:S1-C subfamily serine protease